MRREITKNLYIKMLLALAKKRKGTAKKLTL